MGLRPAGIDEKADEGEEAVTPETVEKERATWAENFVDQCIAKGLEAIALTDHHEMIMVPYVQEAIQTRKEREEDFDLWLFPGMELTAKGGRQCLLIFDAALSQEWWDNARAKLGIAVTSGARLNSKAGRVEQLSCAYPDIAKELDEHKALRGRYIILPNVSQGNDHTVLTNAAHADFLRMSYVGGYLDKSQTINTLSSRNRDRLSGNNKMWSRREIYPMPTSDSRSDDFGSLGSNDCWIKLAEPTAEAIRQAFLSHHSRIRIDPPKLSSLYIKKMAVNGSIILKTDSLDISPEFNAIIGGRGTGKSTFIEYLTFGLGCSSLDSPSPRYSGGERLSKLVRDTLVSQEGCVDLEIIQDNATFRVVREHTTEYQPRITYPNGSEEQVEIGELRRLFPAVVYSQGELGEIGKQTQGQTDLTDLLQFVDPSYKRAQEKLLEAIDSSGKGVSAAIEELVDQWGTLAKLNQQTLHNRAETQRFSALQATLPKLSPEDKKTMKYYDAARRFEGSRLGASQHADRVLRQLDALYLGLAEEHDLTSSIEDDVEELRDHYHDFYTTFETGVEAVRRELRVKRSALAVAESNWTQKLELARAERDKAFERLGRHQEATDQLIKLQESIAESANEITEIQSQLNDEGDMQRVLEEAKSQHKENVREYRAQTKSWAAGIESLSKGKIRADVTTEGDKSRIINALTIFASGTGSQEQQRERRFIEMLEDQGADSIVEGLTNECLALLEWRQRQHLNVRSRPRCLLLDNIVGKTKHIQDAIASRLDLVRVSAIATAAAMPSIELYYRDEHREISFEKASEGQRAAALLLMLLEQQGGPLVIDQPEGDLDNKIITSLTESLHHAKGKRQLIFASHNANIVVNGSAELVANLELAEDGKREFVPTGAIDENDVREVITSTMEGGEKAFRDRMEKYGY